MKHAHEPVEGYHYEKLESGVIVARNPIPHIDAPYEEEKIPDYLSLVDHTLHIKHRRHYRKALAREQHQFQELAYQLKEKGLFMIILVEGMDGTGKSGLCKRVRKAMDDNWKMFDVVPIYEPKQEELEHFWFWKYMRDEHMPPIGCIRYFDRTWHERVLVEKVMELTPKDAIQRSYAETRLMERALESMGGILVKIYLDITKDEQARRFKERKARHPRKVSKSDKIARAHWDEYMEAGNEMLHRIPTWHIVPADDPWYARVVGLQVLNNAMRARLGHK